ncbi:MAG: NAD(P)-dependent oxidoreductase [archaeon]|nr:NAD(P)-dependent oxidoreductase [archaeon]
MSKNCLVTGASGFVGSNMVKLLLNNGYKVRATDLSEKSFLIDYSKKTDNLEFITADLLNKDSVANLMDGIDWVFHVAGLFRFEASKELLWNANVNVVKNVVAAAQERNIKGFVQISTVGVYGSPKREEGKPINEETEPAPGNNYEISKYEGEKVVRDAIENSNFPAIILRPSIIYGNGSLYGMELFVAIISMLKQRRGEKPLINLKDGPTAYSVHVEDVVGSALFLIEQEKFGETYLLSDDTPLKVGDFAAELSEMLGLNLKEKERHLNPKLLKRVGKMMPAVPKTVFKAVNNRFGKMWKEYLEETGLNSPIDMAVSKEWVYYLLTDHLFSNQKVKDHGYQFKYGDFYKGMGENIEWMRDQGWVHR